MADGGQDEAEVAARRTRRALVARCSLLVGLGGLTAAACGVDLEGDPLARLEQRFAVNAYQTPKQVLVNQIGYLRQASKVAVVNGNTTSCAARSFTVVRTSDNVTVHTGTTSAATVDPGSGDSLCKADFSALTATGTYKVVVTGVGDSDNFVISNSDLYSELYENAVYYFTYHRLGTESVSISLPGSKSGTVSRSWALRPTTGITAYQGWAEGTFNIDGCHADAGDFGVYGDNAVQSIWVLANLQEYLTPSASLPKVPASGTMPKLLAEVDYGAKCLPAFIPPNSHTSNAGKLAAHKCHDDSWATQPWGITALNADTPAAGRHCMGPSVTSTYAVARASAHLARLVHSHDANKATAYWNAAKDAWTRASARQTSTYQGPSPGPAVGGGDYPDMSPDDDRFAAAVEMYLTARSRGGTTGADAPATYATHVSGSTHFAKVSRRFFDWEKDYSQGNLSLLAYHKKVSSLSTAFAMDRIEAEVIREADAALEHITANGFPNPIQGNDYPWGSNKVVVHSQMIMAYAYDLTADLRYLRGMHLAMDYLMGVNAVKLSFITGYGGYHEKDTHDRQANGNSPKGWLSGGPINASENNDPVTPTGGIHNADNYANADTFASAWGSKENTVDWNAPLAWVAWYLRAKTSDLGGSTVCTPSCSGKVCGSDGCGGTCGSCAAGQSCNTSGQCVGCTPNCTGKQCGDNGCGASCGSCQTGFSCTTAGLCVSSCTPNCTGKTCGSDGCGGSCGTCSSGATCTAEGTCATPGSGACNGICSSPTAIVPSSGAYNSGNLGTSARCMQFQGTIGSGSFWNMDGRTLKLNGVTQTGTAIAVGPERNGGYCIEVSSGGFSWAGFQLSNMTSNAACTPSCTGKTCGPDGCGGSCGTCASGQTCGAAGSCVAACTPSCSGKTCGSDGCGGVCGTCSSGYVCSSSGQCVNSCTPSCAGKTCGSDGCGGSCGTCGSGTTCSTSGTCVGTCTPSCSGKTCGSDGCGGTCGSCSTGQTCNTTGQCVASCTPNCSGKQCGSDGCGGYCGSTNGTCAPGQLCNTSQQCVSACVPDCGGGKLCGSDGCGGSCGTCASGTTCSANQLACETASTCTLATAIGISGGTGNFGTQGAVCYKTQDNIAGWGCSEAEGRTIKVNGTTRTCGSAIGSKVGGFYLFEVSPGSKAWASIYWW
jgi:endoglucanase